MPDADEDDEDKVIKNCREPMGEDGLATFDELRQPYFATTQTGRIRSAYGEIGGLMPSEDGKWYVDRLGEAQGAKGAEQDAGDVSRAIAEQKASGTLPERIQRGDFEPMWTNCESFNCRMSAMLTCNLLDTPLWHLTIE